jgi:hypothetical protein
VGDGLTSVVSTDALTTSEIFAEKLAVKFVSPA